MVNTNWLKTHYDRVALIAAGIFLFLTALSIWWNAIQFGNRLVAQPGPPPKNASPPPVAMELDRAAERLQHPSQWKSSTRSGLFVPEKHFIGANGFPATLQNTQVHAPVPNDWIEKFGLPIQDADVLEQDPDIDGFTNLDEWQGGTDPTNKDSHPDYLTKLHLVSAKEEPFPFIFSSWVGGTFALNTIDQSEPTQFLKVGAVIGGTDFKIVKFTEKHERDQYGTRVDVSELLLEHKATHVQVTLVKEKKLTKLGSSAGFPESWFPSLPSVKSLGIFKQKETKLAKVSWRAELCDAVRVRNSSVTGSPAFAQLRRGSQEITPPFVRLFASSVIFCFVGICFSAVCASSFAQTPDNIAEREVNRRQTGISQGEAALARGQAAMKAKDYGAAHEEFRTAVTYLPDAVVSGKAHDEAVEGFCKSGVVLAQARIAEGRYADAEAILSEVLSDRYDSKCRAAQELYSHLRQPGYFNKTMSPTFIEKVEQVKQLLTEADGFYNSGRYDLAMKRYDQVLALDPYNSAARKGQEKINNTKYKYGEEAYNETRSRQLWQVEKGWEQPVRRYGGTGEPARLGIQKNLTDTARINNKLNTIIIPRVEFRDATLREAVNFLRVQAVENDPATEGA